MKILPIYINRKSKIFQTFLLFFILSILSYFLVFSKTNYKIMSNIVNVFLEILLPSLFPFILFSNILTYSGCFDLIAKSKFNKIIKRFFKVSSYTASAIIFGFLFGYPNGARYVNQLYEKNKINYDEAEYLLMFINNASPTFILSSIGVGMLQNIKLGIFLLISHIFASTLVGIIYRFKYRINKKNINNPKTNLKNNENIMNFSFDVLYSSISKSLLALGIIFGFMTIFILLYNYLITILNYILPTNNNLKAALLCIMEISSGIKNFTKLDINLKDLLPIISFFLGFSSLSIIFQIFSSVYLNKFKLKNILIGKFLHGILSYLITYILINIPYVYEYVNIGKEANSNLGTINIPSNSNNCHIFISLSIFILHILIFYIFIILKKKRLAKN